ncbi:MAG: hypothetical protein ACTSSF_00395 [Candidatus Heimdallarchaeaceae archaeon]
MKIKYPENWEVFHPHRDWLKKGNYPDVCSNCYEKKARYPVKIRRAFETDLHLVFCSRHCEKEYFEGR